MVNTLLTRIQLCIVTFYFIYFYVPDIANKTLLKLNDEHNKRDTSSLPNNNVTTLRPSQIRFKFILNYKREHIIR